MAFMSPVSPVSLKKTVSFGLKNKLREGTSIPYYWETRLVKGSFQIEVLSLSNS